MRHSSVGARTLAGERIAVGSRSSASKKILALPGCAQHLLLQERVDAAGELAGGGSQTQEQVNMLATMTETKIEPTAPAAPRLWTPEGFRDDEWTHADSADALAGNGRFILPLQVFLGLDPEARQIGQGAARRAVAAGRRARPDRRTARRIDAGGAGLSGLQRRPQLLQGRAAARAATTSKARSAPPARC